MSIEVSHGLNMIIFAKICFQGHLMHHECLKSLILIWDLIFGRCKFFFFVFGVLVFEALWMLLLDVKDVSKKQPKAYKR